MNSLQNNLVPFVPFVPGTSSTNSTNEHRYKLASNKVSKLDCPYCGAKKHWQRYIDIETGEVLPDIWGRCDNADKCGQWDDPYKDGYAKMIWEQENGNRSEIPNNWKPKPKKIIPQPTREPIFFNIEEFQKTLKSYDKNIFIQNLRNNVLYPFNDIEIANVIDLYHLGTIPEGYRAGAITFPFIDVNENIRTIQVKEFDANNHTKKDGTGYYHTLLEFQYKQKGEPIPGWLEAYNRNETKVSCLFGEHNLKDYPNAKIYLFEAPKTAIYSTFYFGHPRVSNILCLAVYNKSSFSFDKLKVLQGRFVYVFPDLSKDGNTFKEWETKAKEYELRMNNTRFVFSNLLEQVAPEEDRIAGLDIADYLIKLDWRQFRQKEHSGTSSFAIL